MNATVKNSTELTDRQELRQKLITGYNRNKTKIDPNLKRELKHGWLMPYIVQIDNLLWGRWDYWARCQAMPEHAWLRLKMEPALALLENREPNPLPKFVVEQTLPSEPIPKINWEYSAATAKMLDRTLDAIPQSGSWRSWGSLDYIRYFLRWAMYGFGHPKHPELPQEPRRCEGASMRLYQTFDAGLLMLYPEDYWGRLLPEISGKESQQATGFFPTPLDLSATMAELISSDASNDVLETATIRARSFYDPCVGTGSMMLAQSNSCLTGVGQDIDSLLLDCALFQFFLYAPWLAIPIWWLNRSDLLLGDSLSQENPVSVNAKFWYEKWRLLKSKKTVQPTMATVELRKSHEPLEPITMPIATPIANNNGKPSIEQLSLFDVGRYITSTAKKKNKNKND